MSTHRRLFRLLSLVRGTLLVLPLSVVAANATTFTVTKTADTNDGSCAAADCSLREAVVAANAVIGPDTIVVPPGIYVLTRSGSNEDLAATGDLDLAGTTTISGSDAASTIIDGFARDRVLDARPGATVTLQRLTLRNGRVGIESGGGIRVAGTGLMQECVVSGSTATNGGGIVVATGGKLTFLDGTISGNGVTTQVSGTTTSGGGVALEKGATASVERSTVSSNVTQGGVNLPLERWGGGLACNGCTRLDVRQSVVAQNRGDDHGGGIVIDNPEISLVYPVLFVRNSEIRENSTSGSGGGIFNGIATTVTIQRTTISGNSAGQRGGAIRYDVGNYAFKISNSTISGNAAGVSGGGLSFAFFTGFGATEPAELISCTLFANYAPSGGAVETDDGVRIHFSNTIVAGSCRDGGSYDDELVSEGGNLESSGDSCNFDRPSDRVNVYDAGLRALAENGGHTPTHALVPGSPATDRGLTANCLAEDQRGEPRPAGSGCDVGAYEDQHPLVQDVSVYYELHPWPYHYVYQGCPGPVWIPEGRGEVAMTMTISAGKPLSFTLSGAPRHGTATLQGNVLTYRTASLEPDEITLVATDGQTSNFVVVPIEVASCAGDVPAPVPGCTVSLLPR